MIDIHSIEMKVLLDPYKDMNLGQLREARKKLAYNCTYFGAVGGQLNDLMQVLWAYVDGRIQIKEGKLDRKPRGVAA